MASVPSPAPFLGPARGRGCSGEQYAMLRARVIVERERETARGWDYDVVVEWPDGACSSHEIGLAWVDHDHWSGGRHAPSHVVERMVDWLIERRAGEGLPDAFDASTVRRWYPDVDELLPGLL